MNSYLKYGIVFFLGVFITQISNVAFNNFYGSPLTASVVNVVTQPAPTPQATPSDEPTEAEILAAIRRRPTSTKAAVDKGECIKNGSAMGMTAPMLCVLAIYFDGDKSAKPAIRSTGLGRVNNQWEILFW